MIQSHDGLLKGVQSRAKPTQEIDYFSQKVMNFYFSLQQVTYCNDDLNSGQKQAVKLTLERPDMAVIHGPPGTGKTTTIGKDILDYAL